MKDLGKVLGISMEILMKINKVRLQLKSVTNSDGNSVKILWKHEENIEFRFRTKPFANTDQSQYEKL